LYSISVGLTGGYDRWRAEVVDYLARSGEEERAATLGGTTAEFYRL
jgi:hypothetical protein